MDHSAKEFFYDNSFLDYDKIEKRIFTIADSHALIDRLNAVLEETPTFSIDWIRCNILRITDADLENNQG